MSHPLTNPVHSFHIPVMGTGFTIDTPLKVARYGISSVVSLVDDVLIEQMRRKVAGVSGRTCAAIEDGDDDARARRITAYLDLMHDLVQDQVEKLRSAAFTAGSEISRYYEMLPDSPLRSLYETMQQVADPVERARLQDELRARVTPGGIDVNIMTKLDRVRLRGGKAVGPLFTDALSALRGYANSRVSSSIVLSAGTEPPALQLPARVRRLPARRGRRVAQAHHPEGGRLPLGPDPGQAAGPATACGSASTASSRA